MIKRLFKHAKPLSSLILTTAMTGVVFAQAIPNFTGTRSQVTAFLNAVYAGNAASYQNLPPSFINSAGQKTYFKTKTDGSSFSRGIPEDWSTSTLWNLYALAFLTKYAEHCTPADMNPGYLNKVAAEYGKTLQPALGIGGSSPYNFALEDVNRLVPQNGGCGSAMIRTLASNMQGYLSPVIQTYGMSSASNTAMPLQTGTPLPFTPQPVVPAPTSFKPPSQFGQKMQGHLDTLIDKGIGKIFRY